MITLDFANAMKECIGEEGLSEEELRGYSERALSALKELAGRRQPETAFLDLPDQDTGGIKETARRIRDGSGAFILLGIGGSALGPRAILEALSPFHNLRKRPRVFIYDNVDPSTLSTILSIAELERSFVNVITKSGSTAETAASFMILYKEMERLLGRDATGRFIATTDPEKGNLREIVRRHGMESLAIPPGVVGRYSVLSPVGLLLAEVIGVDSDELLRGAREARQRCMTEEPWTNPALMLSVLLYIMGTEKGRTIDVLIPYADGLRRLSEWFCQLWAESLGKLGTGFTPYPSVGTTDQHSQLQLWMEGPQDKVIVFLRVDDYGRDLEIPRVFTEMEGISYLSGHTLSELMKAEEESTELALARAGRPNITVGIPAIDAYHLGGLFIFFEIATALTGFLLGVDPFNQPGVEEGKNLTYGMMGKAGFEQKRVEVEAARRRKGGWRI